MRLTRWIKPGIRRRIRREIAIWRIGAIPGLLVIGLIIFLRLLGVLQPLEWWAFDTFLRLRPEEPVDEYILIVSIDEADIDRMGTYPVPDAQLAELITKLQAAQPRAIGLDIIRDLPVEPGHPALVQILQSSKNLIGIEQALPDVGITRVKPPPNLPADQVGFADLISDSDSALRRALADTPTETGEHKFSLPLLLAERYLLAEGYELENGIQDPSMIRFGETEFARFHANSGGYINADARGNQFLINYRSGKAPFHTVSLAEVLSGNVPTEWIRDRVVLIGVTAISIGDLKRTRAVDHDNYGLIYGVEAHAHITSQILNAVLEGRPNLQTWTDPWEYSWIVVWGIIGISLGRFFVVPSNILLGLGLASLILIGTSFAAILAGWWIPLVPAFLVLLLNSAGLTASLFYRYQQDLQARLQDRQMVIEQTYTTIHNIPVQTLKQILSSVRQNQFSPEHLCVDLERLEQELRAIEETVRQETLNQSDQLYLCGGKKLNLQYPIHQLLYEIYRVTLTRTHDFPVFDRVIKIVSFEDINNRSLTMQQKQGLCRFLEEALCNAGKYAEGMTRLEVRCQTKNGWNIIRIVDNGIGTYLPSSQRTGYGTRQARNLAHQLGGKFKRVTNTPKGTICELTYPVHPFWFWTWRRND